MSPRYHLTQLNIARMIAPLEHPQMADFVAQLDRINALAEASPGFVWRLQSDDGDATAIRAFADDRLLVNMPVWESVSANAFRRRISRRRLRHGRCSPSAPQAEVLQPDLSKNP